MLGFLLIASVIGQQADVPPPDAEEELSEQEKFAQEILSLFNYPVYTGIVLANFRQ